MNQHQQALAQDCLDAADRGTMTFPQIVGALMQVGFESYAVDFRRNTATYHLPSGDNVEVRTHKVQQPVATTFDPTALKAAITEAQTLAPDYTYRGFCEKAAAAGCAGYLVSFSGRRALYVGRTAETHVEHFPS